MHFNNPYLTIQDKIEMLERWILFHAYYYYQMNDNVVEDYVYDKNAHLLSDMIKKYPVEAKKSRYYKLFDNYDGSTGMDLPKRLELKENKELLERIKFDMKFVKTKA